MRRPDSSDGFIPFTRSPYGLSPEEADAWCASALAVGIVIGALGTLIAMAVLR